MSIIKPISSVLALTLGFPAIAQSQTGAAPTLEEVVVAAQRVQQNLQDVPIAVTAYSGNFLQSRQVVDFDQVAVRTPGLNVTAAFRTQVQPVIRGANSDEDAPGVDLAVGLVVDEVFYGQPIDFSFDLFDIEGVEVLRGPQGTLFGRNVTGGLINIRTKNPVDELEGRVELVAGEDNRLDLRAALNIPIVKNVLSSRITVSSRNSDGAIPNASGPDLLQEDETSIRGKVLFTPNDSLSILIKGEYLRDKSVGIARDIVALGENLLPALASQVDLDPRKASIDGGGAYDRLIKGVSGIITLDTNIGEFSSVTAWRDNRSDLTDADADATPVLILGGPVENDSDQFSQELRHTYTSADGQFLWIGGVYYQDLNYSRTEFVNQIPFPGSFLAIIGLPPIGGEFGDPGFFRQDMETKSHAVFGQITYSPKGLQGLNLTAGARYTKDKKKGFTQDTGIIQPFLVDVSGKWDAVTPKFVVDYKFDEDIMGYVSATRGFKSGGFSSTTTRDNALAGFAPEYVWSYEGGVKSRFLDDRLQMNLALFAADYKDLQFRSGTVGTESFIGNAGKGSIKGIEAEFQFIPKKHIFLFLNYSYQDGKYDELMISGSDFSGNRLPLTPKHSVSVGAEYEVHVPNIGHLIFNADYQYKSSAFLEPENHRDTAQKIDGIINASVSLEFLQGQGKVSLFVNNLTDEVFITRANRLGVFLGEVDLSQTPPFAQVVAGSFNTPRRWGVSLSYNF